MSALLDCEQGAVNQILAGSATGLSASVSEISAAVSSSYPWTV